MMLITGNRRATTDLCSRIKNLFKEAYLTETATNVVELNGVHIDNKFDLETKQD